MCIIALETSWSRSRFLWMSKWLNRLNHCQEEQQKLQQQQQTMLGKAGARARGEGGEAEVKAKDGTSLAPTVHHRQLQIHGQPQNSQNILWPCWLPWLEELTSPIWMADGVLPTLS